MNTDPNDLEPINPRTAKKLFLDHKKSECTESTVRNHSYRIETFVSWCEEKANIDNLNELSGRDIQQFRLWRSEGDDLKTTTLRNQMSGIRVFLKWAASIEAVPPELYDKVLVPRVERGERSREEKLDPEDANEILEYLSKYQYGSQEHTVMALLWETGLRIGAVHSLDLDDLHVEDEFLQLTHRPESDTTLKNGKSGERPVAISTDLAHLLESYEETIRHDVTDDHGREPLLTTVNGRMARSSIRRIVYKVSSPCFRGEDCPDCTETADRKCPEGVYPHAIRRGSITHFLSKDVPSEIVSDRMDVSRDVLDEHYDKRTEERKLEQRRSYLDNL